MRLAAGPITATSSITWRPGCSVRWWSRLPGTPRASNTHESGCSYAARLDERAAVQQSGARADTGCKRAERYRPRRTRAARDSDVRHVEARDDTDDGDE